MTLTVDIGINGAFLTRRWEEPENWMRLTRELGYQYHSFCADVLDPFFSGDHAYQMETAQAVMEAAARYGVGIVDVYTGVATHRFHGLSHRNLSVRERMQQWIVEAMDLTLAMGATRLGGHWDAFSVEALESPEEHEVAWRRVCEQFRKLAAIGRQKGLGALYNEQMYIPSEVPWTLEQSDRFLRDANTPDGCPVRLTLDVGHQAGMHYGLNGPDLDYREWVRRLGAGTEIVHLQQTTPDASHHWPFTPTYNDRGHIRIDAVLEALVESHRLAAQSPDGQPVSTVDRVYLIAEIIPGSIKTEKALLSELEESARYLRQFVPEGGLTLSV
jgi:D-erythrulose 1-phosphate 3-epimerase